MQRSVLSVLRGAVGFGSWLAPRPSVRLFGLGSIGDDPRSVLVGRLFASRESVLAMGLQHPSPQVRRGVLQVGMAIDSVDLIASVLAARRGGPKAQLALVGGGAALFVALGAREYAALATK